MSYLQPFLKSFVKHIPNIQILSSSIQSRNNLLVNYPLSLQKTSSNRLAMISEASVKRGNDLLLLSMGQCIFSSGFSGASQSEEMKINEMLSNMSLKYEVLNAQFIDKMKIYIQLLANTQILKSGSMQIRDYAEYVMNMPFSGLSKADINSRYLLALYQNWQISNKVTFEFMSQELLKRVNEEEFVDACNKGRNIIRNAGTSHMLFAAPFVDKIDHSFTPNCQFDMLYMPHRRSPFIRIRTLRDIKAGQKPTIHYGKLNNYQLLLRYGFCVKDNPYSVFMLPLNFENIIEIFNKNIQWKQKQLLQRNMRLKNFVKLLPNGQLGKQDMTMMRILICDSQNPQSDLIESQTYDNLINKYIRDHAESMRSSIKINSLKVSEDRFIKILEEQEISILDKYLSTHTF